MTINRKSFITWSLTALGASALSGCGIDTSTAGSGTSAKSSPAQNGSTQPSASDSGKSVTVYTADGLNDGDTSFYAQVGKAFEAKTGIKVNIVEAGSGEIVQRVKQESNNPQADLLISLPPFIQQAHQDGSIEPYESLELKNIAAEDRSNDHAWVNVINNYSCMIYNSKTLPSAPTTWEALLDPKYKGLLQYSTPGIAGDGTAFFLTAREVMGNDKANAYMKQLQTNNVGPSSSTGQLAAKVDKGALLVANGDVQMNLAQQDKMPHLGIFFLPGKSGKPTALNLPYSMSLVKNAPNSANAKKLFDFLLGEDAQKLVVNAAGGFPTRTGVTLSGAKGDKLAALTKDLTVVHPDWNTIQKNLNSVVNDWNTATGSL